MSALREIVRELDAAEARTRQFPEDSSAVAEIERLEQALREAVSIRANPHHRAR